MTTHLPTGGTMIRTSDEVRLCVEGHLADDPVAAVVVVHGFCASKDEANVVAVAEELAGLGVDVYRYDARGHGASGGQCTLGQAERHDVAAVVTEARRRCERVVLVGASMGAVAALHYAASDPQLSGVVTVSSPAWWRITGPQTVLAAGMTQTGLGRWLVRRYLRVRLASDQRRPAEPTELVRHVLAPVAVIHGTADRFIPARSAEPLAAAAGGPSRHVLVPGMGHAFQDAALEPIRGAVEWILSYATTASAPA
jgi:alpha-beta hydrolase superfamily lysophospholipase